MAIALVIVTAPNPPGSRQLISPPAAGVLIAPAKVLHGAVRLHGLTSSPTPETQVRVACADAPVAIVHASAAAAAPEIILPHFISASPRKGGAILSRFVGIGKSIRAETCF